MEVLALLTGKRISSS